MGQKRVPSRVLNLGKRLTWVGSIRARTVYPQGKFPRYPLGRSLGRRRSHWGRFGENRFVPFLVVSGVGWWTWVWWRQNALPKPHPGTPTQAKTHHELNPWANKLNNHTSTAHWQAARIRHWMVRGMSHGLFVWSPLATGHQVQGSHSRWDPFSKTRVGLDLPSGWWRHLRQNPPRTEQNSYQEMNYHWSIFHVVG